jgi:hypothetical protein
VQEPQHPMNKKVCVSTAGLDALGMMLMVKKKSIITVNMISEVVTHCVFIFVDLRCV